MSAPISRDHPDVLIGYQQKLLSTTAVYQVILVEKSRRTGFSWAAGAIAALTAAASDDAGGMDVFYMGYNLEMAREFIDYVAHWAKAFNHAATAVEETFFPDPDNPDKDIKAYRISFDSGFKCLALPSSPRSLRGMQGLVIIDEAAFHDDLEEVLKAAFALLIWGGKVLIISTHNGEDHPFNQLVNEVRAGKKPYALMRVTFDDALADGLYERICYVQGKEYSKEAEAAWRQEIIDFYGDDAEEELFCVPSAGSGTYLPGVLVESCASKDIPVLRLSKPDSFAEFPEHLREAEIRDWCEQELLPLIKTLNIHLPSYVGMDFGRHGDLSVIWPLILASNMDRLTPFLIELRNIPFEQQRQILFFLLDRMPRFSKAALDAGGNGAYLAEVAMQRYGSGLVEQIKFSADWYRENMPPYKSAFEDRSILVPKDQDVIGDHRMVEMEGGVAKVPNNKRRKGMDGKERHGDSAIAGALSYFASRSDAQEYGFTSARPTPEGPDYDGGSNDGRLRMTPDDQYTADDGRFGDGAW